MREYRSELLAVSRAGRDRGRIYVVLDQGEACYLLADGKTKLLEKPKRKNEKHVQLIRHLPAALLAQMGQIKEDADLRRIIKAYQDLKQKEK